MPKYLASIPSEGWFRFRFTLNNTALMLSHRPCLAEPPLCCLSFDLPSLDSHCKHQHLYIKDCQTQNIICIIQWLLFMARSTLDASTAYLKPWHSWVFQAALKIWGYHIITWQPHIVSETRLTPLACRWGIENWKSTDDRWRIFHCQVWLPEGIEDIWNICVATRYAL